MMINHNIINKIYNKIWLERMNKVNKEYNRNYVYHRWVEALYVNGTSLYAHGLIYHPYRYHKQDIIIFQETDWGMVYTGRIYVFANPYKYREPSGFSYIKPIVNDENLEKYRYKLPKKYRYSSGLNHENGYKE